MFRSLYSKLAAVLLVLLLVIGGLTLLITLSSTELYQQEVNQKLNRELAQHIVAEKTLIRDKLVDHAALEEIFHMMMVINPAIEFYLLDPAGKILAYSAEPGKVKRDYVSLVPVQQWLEGVENYPLLGDDPRDSQRQKAFSAARIANERGLEGYLYIILGGEDYDSVAQLLAGSYILKASAGVIVIGILISIIAGLILFALLTGKLKRLSSAMTAFKTGDVPDIATASDRGDQIDRLSFTFREMALQIRDQMQKLERTDQLRRELVANVSHDLRTPLATLQGYIETVLMKEHALSPSERREYLETAIRHCRQLNKLVNELLELARLDALEIKPNRETFSMAELMQDVMQKYTLRARAKGVNVETELPSKLPYVNADIGLIERVLENLVENALRYTPPQGRVVLNLEPAERSVTVKVCDTGCGIPEDELPRIFDRFYQLDKSRNKNPGSSGLGLAIAKRILELHGSVINVSSAVSHGTTFSFQLPVSQAA